MWPGISLQNNQVLELYEINYSKTCYVKIKYCTSTYPMKWHTKKCIWVQDNKFRLHILKGNVAMNCIWKYMVLERLGVIWQDCVCNYSDIWLYLQSTEPSTSTLLGSSESPCNAIAQRLGKA